MCIHSNATPLYPITQFFCRLRRAYAIWRSRRMMAGMDRAMLGDLGICASAASFEASRPFWDVARHDQ
jgi:uncharacterized protein YjiS (DUF1127 family)